MTDRELRKMYKDIIKLLDDNCHSMSGEIQYADLKKDILDYFKELYSDSI